MKRLFTIGMIIFWTGTIAILSAGLVINETKNTTTNKQTVDTTNRPDLIPGSTNPDEDINTTYTTVSKTFEKTQYLNSAIVAQHDTRNDCWLTIENTVYDVAEYIPFHPGGEAEIIPSCGTDATAGFNAKGDNKTPHSAAANAILQKYYVADIGDPWGTITVTEDVRVAADGSIVATTETKSEPMITADVKNSTPVGKGRFTIGETVQATDNIKARKTPSTDGALLTIEKAQTTGKITDGPKYSDDYWWYFIKYVDGISGWSVQDYLTKYDPNKPNPSTPVDSSGTPPKTSSELSASAVAKHNNRSDCWLTISNKVYDVTQYIPFHPGGENDIISNCGQDATTAFNTKGGSGSHSTNANNLLNNYYIGDIGSSNPTSPDPDTPATDTTSPSVVIVSPGDNSSVSGSITIQATASDTGGIKQVEFKINSNSLKKDTSSPYSTTLDTTNYSDGSHTVDVIATDNANNTKNSSISININNTPPDTGGGGNSSLTAAAVTTHNTQSDCWMIITDKVYDVTQYIPFHPGGTSRIVNNCGTDSTTLFTSSAGSGHKHSSGATNTLNNYYVGDLDTGPTTPPDPNAPTCTSFTYSAWGSCLSNSTQLRSVLTSSPTSCAGGAPVTSQSCTYTPPASPDQAYRDAIDADYPGADITKLSIEDDGRAEFKFTWNGNSYEGKMNSSYQITQIE